MNNKILTIDDSKTIRMIVARAFKPYACTILEAENGLTGLSVAAKERPNLIILDYTMPVMDGHEALSRLRSDPVLKATPVIMLTAEAGRETVLKMAKLSIQDYLIKPFKEDALLERVAKILPLQSKDVAPARVRRFDDTIQIVVADDKPAIIDQVNAALSDTNWKVAGAADPASAAELCGKGNADIVLASLSLPNDGAFSLLQTLRGNAATRGIPLLGLSVKTAMADQARAHQEGFAGCITKPIDLAELQGKICRTLRLETSYRYFQQRGTALCFRLPREMNPGVAHELARTLKEQLVATVEAGNDKLVVDLGDVKSASLPLIELSIRALQYCQELSLRAAIVASETIRAECRVYQETQAWKFAPTFEEAVVMLR